MRKNIIIQEAPRPFVRRLAGPLVFVFALFYLGFHALSGERGLFVLFTESRRLATLRAEVTEVKTQRMALEEKVRHLSDNSLDLDLLDEQVRRVLGMTVKDEVVYFLDGAPKDKKGK